jgi:hypothetical protein
VIPNQIIDVLVFWAGYRIAAGAGLARKRK